MRFQVLDIIPHLKNPGRLELVIDKGAARITAEHNTHRSPHVYTK